MYTVLRENEFFECQQVKLCIYSAKFKKKKESLTTAFGFHTSLWHVPSFRTMVNIAVLCGIQIQRKMRRNELADEVNYRSLNF